MQWRSAAEFLRAALHRYVHAESNCARTAWTPQSIIDWLRQNTWMQQSSGEQASHGQRQAWKQWNTWKRQAWLAQDCVGDAHAATTDTVLPTRNASLAASLEVQARPTAPAGTMSTMSVVNNVSDSEGILRSKRGNVKTSRNVP